MTTEQDKSSLYANNTWSTGELREYRARLGRLADSIRNDEGEAFSDKDSEALEAAVNVLERYELFVKQSEAPVNPRLNIEQSARKEAQANAEELARKLFPVSQDDILHTAELALAIEASIDAPKVRSNFNAVIADVEQGISQDDPEALTTTISRLYNEQIARLAKTFLDIRGKNINSRYVADWSLRVRRVLDNPEEAEVTTIHKLKQYLAEKVG